jgi:hypothetical protein
MSESRLSKIYRVPFDIRKSPKQNLLEWIGNDDRVMRLITHCEANGIPLAYYPGERICYIDVSGPNGNALVSGDGHSMVIDLDQDKVFLFNDEDIAAGLNSIDRIYDGYDSDSLPAELESLLNL